MTKASYVSANAAVFGKILRRLRLAQGWTVIECARRCGIHKNHLSLLELGKNMPSLERLFEFADVFHVDAADLVREVELARRGRKAARAAAMLAAAGMAPAEAEPAAEAERASEAEPSTGEGG